MARAVSATCAASARGGRVTFRSGLVERGAQRTAARAELGVGVVSRVVVEGGVGLLAEAPRAGERLALGEVEPEAARERVEGAHDLHHGIGRVIFSLGFVEQRARELAVRLEDRERRRDGAAEARALGAKVAGLDRRDGARGARGRERGREPLGERGAGMRRRRPHAHAQVVTAAGAVDVALEEPRGDLAFAPGRRDGGADRVA